MREGSYSLDKSRHAFARKTFNFPKNTEFETMLTFTGSNPGRDDPWYPGRRQLPFGNITVC